MNNNLTPTLNDAQLKQNIDALQSQGLGQSDIQSYVNNYAKGADGNYVLKNTAEASASNKPFRYAVPTTPTDSTTQAANIKSSDQQLQNASNYANSPLGFLANTAGAAGSMISHSEQALGNTLGSISNVTGNTNAGGSNLDALMASRQKLSDAQLAAVKDVNKAKQSGQDPTNAMRAYNSISDQLDQLDSQISGVTAGSQKTNSQVGGELAGTGLDLLSAGTYGPEATAAMESGQLASKLPTVAQEAVGLANKPSGLFTATGALRVAKGAGVGYAYDVANNFQGGKTGAAAATPGVGTLLGAGIPAVTEGTQSVLNAFGSTKDFIAATPTSIISKRMDAITQVENANKGLRNLANEATQKGIDIKTILANTDLLHGSVDDQGVIRTMGKGEAVEQFDNFLAPMESVVSDALDKEGAVVPLTDEAARNMGLPTEWSVESQLRDNLESSNVAGSSKIAAQNAIDKEIAGLKIDANSDGTIDLGKVQDAKITNSKNVNWSDAESTNIKKSISLTEKGVIENNSSEKVQSLNAELAKYYTIRDYLQTLDGKRVQGGRLGKYFAETLGGIAGSHFGPIGVLGGGYIAGKLKGSSLAGTFGGELGNDMSTSPLMQAALARNKATVPLMPRSQ